MVRVANAHDIPRILSLLHQVNMVHHRLRPDLFKPHTTKYNEAELLALINNEQTPIFVYDDNNEVLGYAFCQLTEVTGDLLLVDNKTLYILYRQIIYQQQLCLFSSFKIQILIIIPSL